jgi:hypothetical protein
MTRLAKSLATFLQWLKSSLVQDEPDWAQVGLLPSVICLQKAPRMQEGQKYALAQQKHVACAVRPPIFTYPSPALTPSRMAESGEAIVVNMAEWSKLKSRAASNGFRR